MTVQGVRDKIVAEIQPIADAKTEAGLYIPESATKSMQPQLTCVVISKGPEVVKEINIGDTIFCHQQAGMDIISDGIILKVLKDDEVYATVKENVNE